MKAKVIDTGVEIEVEKIMDSMYHDVNTSGIDEKTYYESDLEFLPDTEEVTLVGYVARGANPHHLALYERKPDRLSDIWGFSHSLQLDPTSFPEVTWDSEPLKVKITITPME